MKSLENGKRYNRRFMTVQKTRPRTQHSGLRPQAASKLLSTASSGGPGSIWVQDTVSAASRPNSDAVKTQSRSLVAPPYSPAT